MIPKIMKYVKRFVTRDNLPRQAPQPRPRCQKSGTVEYVSVYVGKRLSHIEVA